MAQTTVKTRQIGDGEVKRDDLNVTTVGQSVARKVLQGWGIALSSTGADAGTGDVTVSLPAQLDVGTGYGGLSIGHADSWFVSENYGDFVHYGMSSVSLSGDFTSMYLTMNAEVGFNLSQGQAYFNLGGGVIELAAGSSSIQIYGSGINMITRVLTPHGASDRYIEFIPTQAGWYRILTTYTMMSGRIEIASDFWNNGQAQIGFDFTYGSYGTSGEINQYRHGSYNGEIVTQARLSTNTATWQVYLDIYVANPTATGKLYIYGWGKNMPTSFSATYNPVVGDAYEKMLIFGKGFNSTAGIQVADNVETTRINGVTFQNLGPYSKKIGFSNFNGAIGASATSDFIHIGYTGGFTLYGATQIEKAASVSSLETPLRMMNTQWLGTALNDRSASIFIAEGWTSGVKLGLHSYLIRDAASNNWWDSHIRLSSVVASGSYSQGDHYTNMSWLDFWGASYIDIGFSTSEPAFRFYYNNVFELRGASNTAKTIKLQHTGGNSWHMTLATNDSKLIIGQNGGETLGITTSGVDVSGWVKASYKASDWSNGITQSVNITAGSTQHTLTFKDGLLTGYNSVNI